MRLENLHQPPFETTFMGVVEAVLEHHGHSSSAAMVYGGSGHAFLVNVHEAICPSGPYCWNCGGMFPLLRNLGIEVTDLGFFHSGTPPEERAEVEGRLRGYLDQGIPCSLCNMDHQVIEGYDEQAFFTARPWPKNPDYPPGTLTFTEWTEFGKEVHVNFFVHARTERADDRKILIDSLRYAVDLSEHPEKHECERYAVGPRAYDLWAAAAQEHGSSHGNWWNGTVWSECRTRASEYLGEVAGMLEEAPAAVARDLSARYGGIAAGLSRLSDKTLDPKEKAALAREVRDREVAAVAGIRNLLSHLC